MSGTCWHRSTEVSGAARIYSQKLALTSRSYVQNLYNTRAAALRASATELSWFATAVFPKNLSPLLFPATSACNLQRAQQQREEFVSQVFMAIPERAGNYFCALDAQGVSTWLGKNRSKYRVVLAAGRRRRWQLTGHSLLHLLLRGSLSPEPPAAFPGQQGGAR